MNNKIKIITAGSLVLLIMAGTAVWGISNNIRNNKTGTTTSESFRNGKEYNDTTNSTEHIESETVKKDGGKMTEEEYDDKGNSNSNIVSNDESLLTSEDTDKDNSINNTDSKSESANSGEKNESNISEDNKSSESNNSSVIIKPSFYEEEVSELVNKERAVYGLLPLTLNIELCDGARAKSLDMQQNNYFDHNSPTYGTPFEMMKKFGITYTAAGENIAKGYKTPQEVVTGWMNSKGHRENILSEKYTSIGVGYVDQGNYWTQWFARF